MKSDRGDENFIAHLLEETYQTVGSDGVSPSVGSLRDYFNQASAEHGHELDPTLDNFLSRQAIDSQQLQYNARTGCYRLLSGKLVLDFPSNWGPFERLGREITFIDLKHSDLMTLLRPHVMSDTRAVIIGNFGSVRIVYFQIDDEFSLRWLEKFFSYEQKKEAA